MAEEREFIILRQQCPTCDDIELFVGNGDKGKIFIINLDKQLDWLKLIADNIRNYRKRNA